ncbi:M13 family metallopeptidase [Granulicella sp. dw_53]|uniref:M13 family metallopeptidase n=1 Tax=Granulicella sp. dw_53 TaxID=2719792 RepID=UPI0021085CEB|nr:M13 family metallopeptidase [Granulicella sp. dw_53]
MAKGRKMSRWSKDLHAIGLAAAMAAGAATAVAQSGTAATGTSDKPTQVYLPVPGFDATSMDTAADPCNDFYKFACGKFAANHPIPADQSGVDQFYELYNVNTQSLRGILDKAAVGGAGRSPDAQKIGDYYKACMDTDAINQKGLAPLQPMLDEIDGLKNKLQLAGLIGRMQRMGVDVFFSYGEQQDFKDASKQIASIQQGGLGLPEKDYYLRAGAKDEQIRKQYLEHVTKMLTLAGSSPQQALKDATAIVAMETSLAKASMGVVDLRDPEKVYHLQPIATFEKSLPGVNFNAFEEGVASPKVSEINNATPQFFPALLTTIRVTDLDTLKAYMRYHLLTTAAGRLPKVFDEENFDFYGRKLTGQPEQAARWKRCSNAVNGALGEALGKVYVEQYFAGDSKAKMLEMVHDIEAAMGRDIDQVDWMSAPTKLRAKEKLHAVANKIGYPDKWRDYTKLEVKPDDALGNTLRATAFENDRQLGKIGKPVDHSEWGMTPPTVNAYYDPSMNDINFPAGILQPSFYDKSADDATNYGHIGAVIGHELTHGFDDEGKKFDAKGNMSDWWTPEDTKKFEARTDCLVNEYGGFTAVDDVKVNGKLTLGENTADNGGLLLAYMAYLERAKVNGVDLNAKVNGYTAPQRLYIGYAQNWCENARPEQVRNQVLTDPHSPDHFRANGAIVNQPGFADAFGCKKGTPMVPANSCRVW